MKKTLAILLALLGVVTLSAALTSDAQAWYSGGVYGPGAGFSYGIYGTPSASFYTGWPSYYYYGGSPYSYGFVPTYKRYRVYKPYRAYRSYRHW